MKTSSAPAWPACAVALSFVVLASSATTGAAEPPRSHLEPARAATGGPPSSATFGLKLTRASAVLREQLALKRGAGLVVDEIASGSPAARAGFAQHDVLVKLDDQMLLLPEQFNALLEAADGEAPLDCTVLRGGREVVVPLALGRPAPPRALRGTAATGGLRPAASALAIVQQATPKNGPIEARPLRRLADETLVRHDPDYQITLTGGEETRLHVSDPQGRVVFDEAIDTPTARSRMPRDVRERVAEMERLLESERRPTAGTVPVTLPPAPAAKAEVGSLGVPPIELR
jgi:hypothetical protein